MAGLSAPALASLVFHPPWQALPRRSASASSPRPSWRAGPWGSSPGRPCSPPDPAGKKQHSVCARGPFWRRGGLAGMDLNFHPFEVVALLVAVLLVAELARTGSSNWLAGVWRCFGEGEGARDHWEPSLMSAMGSLPPFRVHPHHGLHAHWHGVLFPSCGPWRRREPKVVIPASVGGFGSRFCCDYPATANQ